jgi:hypothetical protein
MKFAVHGSALSRRVVLMLGVVSVLALPRIASAQAAAAPQDQFQFKTPMGWVLWQVRADKSADFESAWVAIKTKFAASEKPEHKAVAESLKMYKPDAPPVDAPGVGQVAFYYFVIDPASQTQSYNPTALLYETGELFPRAEADAIFEKLKGALVGIDARPLKRLQ